MGANSRKIEVDAQTADLLEARAAAEGLSVSELVAGMTVLQGTALTLPSEDIAELDCRWGAVQAGEPTVAHDEVARWLETWGTPAFKPWHEK